MSRGGKRGKNTRENLQRKLKGLLDERKTFTDEGYNVPISQYEQELIKRIAKVKA